MEHTRTRRAFVSIRPIHALVVIALATTATASLTVTSVTLGWPVCIGHRNEQFSFSYTPDPDLSPEINSAMARFYDLASRSGRWTETEWAWLKDVALRRTVPELQTQAMYWVGEEAKDHGISRERAREWIQFVRPMLDDPHEFTRAAALYVLKHLDAPVDFDLSDDPSPYVRISWQNSFGR